MARPTAPAHASLIFSEEKAAPALREPKVSYSPAASTIGAMACTYPQRRSTKVFCFFSSEKKDFALP
jgi:hypothetical protein